MLTDYFLHNLDIIYFVYGLAFFSMGIAIFVHPRSGSTFKLAHIIGWLGAFGLIHGTNEWLEMFTLLKGSEVPLLAGISPVVLFLSYLCLFEFSRRLIIIDARKIRGGFAVVLFYLVLAFTIAVAQKTSSILPRYLLALPGSILACCGFIRYYHTHRVILLPLNLKFYFYSAAIAFAAYGILGGVITPAADFFPANVLNNAAFFHAFGIPVQLLRAVCAATIALSVWNILGIFSWEENTKCLQEIKVRKEAEKKLGNALKVKSAFIAMVSHELRTPLTAIKESINIVCDGAAGTVTAQQKDFLHIARENVERLAHFINDVLDLQKIEAGKMEFVMVRGDVNLLAAEVVRSLQAVAANKGLALAAELSPELPQFGFDRDKIIEVMMNLVGNAIQYTDTGSITVRTTKRQHDAVISVTDTGVGIAADDIPRLFSSFVQLDNVTTRTSGRTGLGLVISKEIVERHGGRLWVESVYGKGSIFTFTLPVTRSAE